MSARYVSLVMSQAQAMMKVSRRSCRPAWPCGSFRRAQAFTSSLVLHFMVCLPFCNAQSPLTQRERNADGLALISQSVEAMGGRAGWSRVKSVRVHGALSSEDGAVQTYFQWSNDATRKYETSREAARSGTHNQNGANQSDQASATAQQAAAKRSVFQAKFDAFTSLLPHAPGIAMTLVLEDERYTVSAPRRLASSNCVDISLPGILLQAGGVLSRLCFSDDTRLLTDAASEVPLGPDPRAVIVQKLRFEDYEARGGLLYPTKVPLTLPGSKRVYTFHDGPEKPIDSNAGGAQ